MARTRASGEGSKGNTRDAIIAAAHRVLARDGYDAATIKAVAREAGVAPGLLHYYFGSKDDLLAAVLRAISDAYVVDGRQMIASHPPDALAHAGIRDAQRRAEQQPETYRLRYELFALGLRNPTQREGVAALLANARAGIAAVARQADGAHTADPDALAAVLLACFDGLALQRLVDPHFDLAGAYAVLVRMVDGLVGPS